MNGSSSLNSQEPQPATGEGLDASDLGADAGQLLDDLRVVMSRRTAGFAPASGGGSLEGTRLHQYAIGRLLGEGGMAEVYRTLDTETGQSVAVKVLKPQCRRDREVCARFAREARSMARIEHPNVVRILGVAESGDISAIVMEFLAGGSLADLLAGYKSRRQCMAVDEAVSTVAQAAQGLHAAHQLGIVHRDVKPSNVLLDGEGLAKVADFGTIRLTESTTWLTGMNQSLGTPAYMSPEQCQGERCAPTSDVYSLGVTLFEMVTGRFPFDAEEISPYAVMRAHIQEAPPDPRSFRQGLPAWLCNLILRCLQKDPAARYLSAGELAEALLTGGPAASAGGERTRRRPPGSQMDMLSVCRQLQHLPHRAIVCWACRCARRVQPLNPDARLDRAIAAAEVFASQATEEDTLLRARCGVAARRAASLTVTLPGEDAAGCAAAEAAAAAAHSVTARCIPDAAGDAAYAARSAVAALGLAGQSARSFWQKARADYWRLQKATAGQEGTTGQPIAPALFDEGAGP